MSAGGDGDVFWGDGPALGVVEEVGDGGEEFGISARAVVVGHDASEAVGLLGEDFELFFPNGFDGGDVGRLSAAEHFDGILWL